MRWHPATIIYWCLYLHCKSSGHYSTLINEGILHLPSWEKFARLPACWSFFSGFSKFLTSNHIQDIALEQTPQPLAKFVSVYSYWWDVYKGRTNILEHFMGYWDIGDINNLLTGYEREYRESGRTPTPLVKWMLACINGL